MSELQAGRELDAKVAEAMGFPMEWQVAEVHHYAGGKLRVVTRTGAPATLAECEKLCAELNHGSRRRFSPVAVAEPYSTDIAAAWEVVERMRGDGFAFEVSSVWHGEGTYASFARWERIVGEGPYYADVEPDGQNRADTAPLAICRAAIAALDARSPSMQEREK